MVDTFSGALKILWRRKTSSSPGDGRHVLQKSLSILDITCLGLSTTLGTGVYIILAFAAREHSGPSIVLSFLISSVASCLGGLCYSELCNRFPSGGSAYCYVYSCLGELPAFLIGWSLALEYVLAVSLSTKSLIEHIDYITNGTLITSLRFYPSIDSSKGNIFFDFPSALLVIILGFLLTRNLKSSCVYNNILVFISLLMTGAIVLCCISEADSGNWTAGPGFFANGIIGTFSGASVCFFAFNGYDIIGCLSAECLERTRIVSLAMSLTFLLGLIACFTLSIAITLLVPFSLLDPTVPLLEAFVTRHLDGMKYFVIIGATAALISSSISSLLSLSRLFFSLSNDGLFLSFLSKYDTKRGLSKNATLFSSIMCAISCVCFESSTILYLIGTGTILSFMSTAVCIIFLRYSSVERLPFESHELISRETSHSEFRPHFHDIRHSVSDYYLNERRIAINREQSSDCSQFERYHENSLYDAICDDIHSSDADIREKGCAHNYGSCETTTRTMSVEFINHTFITSITDLPIGLKQIPSEKSANIVTGTTFVMMGTMLLMSITTTHVSRLLNDENQWWTEIFSALFFIIICGSIIIIAGQPQHCTESRNSIETPCTPLLPICSIWLDLHLIVCLPYTSWLAFVIWSLLGIFVYMSYGVWNSLEGLSNRDLDHINGLGLTETSDDSEDIIATDNLIIGSSV